MIYPINHYNTMINISIISIGLFTSKDCGYSRPEGPLLPWQQVVSIEFALQLGSISWRSGHVFQILPEGILKMTISEILIDIG